MTRLLLIDDDVDCLRPLTQLFELEGFEVVTAGAGLEALAAMRAQRFDLILLDLIMPRMNGVQFLEELRKDRAHDALPILLVTAQHDVRLERRATQLGIKEYLFKTATPFQRLLALVQQHLGQTPRVPNPDSVPRPRHHRKKG